MESTLVVALRIERRGIVAGGDWTSWILSVLTFWGMYSMGMFRVAVEERDEGESWVARIAYWEWWEYSKK